MSHKAALIRTQILAISLQKRYEKLFKKSVDITKMMCYYITIKAERVFKNDEISAG